MRILQSGRALFASWFDVRTDFFWLREDDGRAVAAHAHTEKDWLAGVQAGIGGVGLEAQVEFPDFVDFPGLGGHDVGVGIGAVADRLDDAVGHGSTK